MQSFKKFFKEQTIKVVAHGFSDRGVSSYRYTMIDANVNLNQQADHKGFEDDYDTIVYNSIEDAYKESLESIKGDKLDLKNFKQDFFGELLRNDTVIVYSFHQGNHFQEPAKTMLVQEEGDWNEVPLEIDKNYIIAEYNSTNKEYNLRKDVPYEEVAPRRETTDKIFQQEKDKKTITLPKSKTLQAVINHYEESVLAHQMAASKKGEYTVGQMEEVKDKELFINLLKEGKLTGYDALWFVDYLKQFVKWFPQYKEDTFKLIDNIKNQFKGVLSYVGW